MISSYEWTALIGALRYYQYRRTIAAAMFPQEVAMRFFGDGNRYDDDDRNRIAEQFVNVDHHENGVASWSDDFPEWKAFFMFLYAWLGRGLYVADVRNPETGKREEVLAFKSEYRLRPFREFPARPNAYINPIHIVGVWKMTDGKRGEEVTL